MRSFLAAFILVGCSTFSKSLNVFPVSSDLNFGAQAAAQIDKDNKNNILDSTTNGVIYRYLYSIRDSIFKNNEIDHEARFPWRIRIINDPTLNAFCTPGGYIYFYTGILKYLQSEDELAGVMGHEMAHAEKRHSTDAMTREFGANLLLELIFGTNKAQLLQVATGLAQLSFGRDAETEADNCSVDWLYQTSYNPVGAAGFFEKIQKEKNQVNIPEFLSTHPDPGNRVANMKKRWAEKGGKTGATYTERYKKMLTYLP